MAVLGNLDALGHWKTPLYFLKWTEGDWWVSEKPLIVKNTHHFNYKYAMIENKKQIVGWERGVDRIADLVIMQESNFSDTQTSMIKSKYSNSNIKNVEYKDTWETFTMALTIWSFDENYDGMILDSHHADYKDAPMQKKVVD